MPTRSPTTPYEKRHHEVMNSLNSFDLGGCQSRVCPVGPKSLQPFLPAFGINHRPKWYGLKISARGRKCGGAISRGSAVGGIRRPAGCGARGPATQNETHMMSGHRTGPPLFPRFPLRVVPGIIVVLTKCYKRKPTERLGQMGLRSALGESPPSFDHGNSVRSLTARTPPCHPVLARSGKVC